MSDERYDRSADMRLLELQREALGVPARAVRTRKYADFDPLPEVLKDDDEEEYVQQGAVLIATLEAQPRRSLIAGAVVTMSLVVANDGDLPARGVHVALPLPVDSSFRSGSLVLDGAESDDAIANDLFGNGIELGEIEPNSRRSIVVKVSIEAALADVTVTAHVSAVGGAILGPRALRLTRGLPSSAPRTAERPFYEEVDESDVPPGRGDKNPRMSIVQPAEMPPVAKAPPKWKPDPDLHSEPDAPPPGRSSVPSKQLPVSETNVPPSRPASAAPAALPEPAPLEAPAAVHLEAPAKSPESIKAAAVAESIRAAVRKAMSQNAADGGAARRPQQTAATGPAATPPEPTAPHIPAPPAAAANLRRPIVAPAPRTGPSDAAKRLIAEAAKRLQAQAQAANTATASAAAAAAPDATAEPTAAAISLAGEQHELRADASRQTAPQSSTSIAPASGESAPANAAPPETAPVVTASIESSAAHAPLSEAAPIRPTAIEAAALHAAPIQAAPIEAAPIQAAPIEATAFEAAPVEAAVVQAAAAPVEAAVVQAAAAPVEAAVVEAAALAIQAAPASDVFIEAAPIDAASIEGAQVEAAAVEAPPLEAEPIRTAAVRARTSEAAPDERAAVHSETLPVAPVRRVAAEPFDSVDDIDDDRSPDDVFENAIPPPAKPSRPGIGPSSATREPLKPLFPQTMSALGNGIPEPRVRHEVPQVKPKPKARAKPKAKTEAPAKKPAANEPRKIEVVRSADAVVQSISAGKQTSAPQAPPTQAPVTPAPQTPRPPTLSIVRSPEPPAVRAPEIRAVPPPETPAARALEVARVPRDIVRVEARGGPLLTVALDRKRLEALNELFSGPSVGMIAHYLLLNALAAKDALAGDGQDPAIAAFISGQQRLLTLALETSRLGTIPAVDSLGTELPPFPPPLPVHSGSCTIEIAPRGETLLIRTFAPTDVAFLRRTLANTKAALFLRAAQLIVGLCANDAATTADADRRAVNAALATYSALATAEISRIFLRSKLNSAPVIFKATDLALDDAARSVLAALGRLIT